MASSANGSDMVSMRLNSLNVRSFRSSAIFGVALTLLWAVVGCGGTSDAPVNAPGTSEQPTAQPAAEQQSTSNAATAADKPRRRDEVWVDENGQKWFGNIPMDVFFDEPYTIASDQTPLGGAGNAMSATGNPAIPSSDSPVVAQSNSEPMTDLAAGTPAVTEPATEAASSGGDGWDSLITAAQIDEEVKSTRNFLAENLQSVGNYNSSMLMLPPRAATMAMLAGVAMDHPEAVSWKEDAKYIRDLAKKMNASTLQRGPKDQKRLLELSDAITDTLNRSKPAGLEEPPETDSFSDTAEMRLLMNRMEDAEKKLKTEAGSEGSMKSKKDMVLLEASLLGVMARTITLSGYGYEDDDEFKGYAKEILNASQTIKTSAEAGDFATYEGALTKISQSCSNCHMKFRSE
jgi:hypothetical protein